MAEPSTIAASSGLGGAPAAPEKLVYTESKAYVFSLLGGMLTLFLVKAYLFRFNHPDVFYEALAGLTGLMIGLLLWFPPRLVLDSTGIRGSSFGYVWLDCPWKAIERMDLFRTPEVKGPNGTTGGRRALGFVLKREFDGRIKPRSGAYGYGAAITSMWNFSFDQVANQCAHFWRASGGDGELISRLDTYQSDVLKLTSS